MFNLFQFSCHIKKPFIYTELFWKFLTLPRSPKKKETDHTNGLFHVIMFWLLLSCEFVQVFLLLVDLKPPDNLLNQEAVVPTSGWKCSSRVTADKHGCREISVTGIGPPLSKAADPSHCHFHSASEKPLGKQTLWEESRHLVTSDFCQCELWDKDRGLNIRICSSQIHFLFISLLQMQTTICAGKYISSQHWEAAAGGLLLKLTWLLWQEIWVL